MRNPLATVADVWVETLQKAGVERVYGVAGDSLNGLTDSIRAQIDIRGEQIGRRTRVDIGLIGDVKYTLLALMPLLKKHKSGHLHGAVKHFRKVRQELDDRAVGKPGVAPIHPQYLTRCISDLAAEDAVFLCDVGTPTTWSARYLQMNGKRRYLVPSTMARWLTPCPRPSAFNALPPPAPGGHSFRR